MKTPDRILVPVDFSEYSLSAFVRASDLAQLFDAELDLIHVLVEPAFPAFYSMGEDAMYGEASTLEERSREAMAALIEEAEGVQPKKGLGIHVQRGKPAETIIKFAEEHGVDLIVIASRGLSGVERMLMGSVASGVVKMAECDVYVLKKERR